MKIFPSVDTVCSYRPTQNWWTSSLHYCCFLPLAVVVSEKNLLLKFFTVRCFFIIWLIDGSEVVISRTIRCTEYDAVLCIWLHTFLILVVVVTDRFWIWTRKIFSLPRSLNRWITQYTTYFDTHMIRTLTRRNSSSFCKVRWWKSLSLYKITN